MATKVVRTVTSGTIISEYDYLKDEPVYRLITREEQRRKAFEKMKEFESPKYKKTGVSRHKKWDPDFVEVEDD